MSQRLADYFVVVGYNHERKNFRLKKCQLWNSCTIIRIPIECLLLPHNKNNNFHSIKYFINRQRRSSRQNPSKISRNRLAGCAMDRRNRAFLPATASWLDVVNGTRRAQILHVGPHKCRWQSLLLRCAILFGETFDHAQ